jgi:cell division protein FtsW
MLGPALIGLAVISLLPLSWIRRLALLALIGGIIGIVGTLLIGEEIKGARRWLPLPGLSVQPSEFVKPAFAVVAAWLFTLQRSQPGFPGTVASMAVYGLIVALLLMQPDLGMAAIVTAVWGLQFFLAGLPMIAVLLLAGLAVGGAVMSYFTFSHVASRIDRFLSPESGDTHQIDQSLGAFANGGLWGVGPGEGSVKWSLPDAHADFAFAVAGEEFGLIWCLVLVGLFAVIVLRSMVRLVNDGGLFSVLAGAGLAGLIGFQALVNMGSTLSLIPTKGMTLPFISYGGSSLLASCFALGMLLALSRRRAGYGAEDGP